MESSPFSMWRRARWFKLWRVMPCQFAVSVSHPTPRCCWPVPMMGTWSFMMCKFLRSLREWQTVLMYCSFTEPTQMLWVPFPATPPGFYAFPSPRMASTLPAPPAIAASRFGTPRSASACTLSPITRIRCGAFAIVRETTRWPPPPKTNLWTYTTVHPMPLCDSHFVQ